jgi:stringent starvation protein B
MSGVIPYLIRAYCNWIEDSNLTPYVLVNPRSEGLSMPDGFENNGKIVLNISASATVDRLINNESISFKARFHGKSQKIIVPCEAVMSIYAHENGEGMLFDNKVISSDKGDKKPNFTILD